MSFQPIIGIYALLEPDTDRVMYVGQSIDVMFRYRQHCDSLSADPNFGKIEWVGELRHEGRKPKLVVLEEVKTEEALDGAERRWIHHFKALGQAELNISSGGGNPAISSVANAPREEWFQFAHQVREARRLLSEVGNAAGKMASAKHCDAFLKIERKFDREIDKIERRVLSEFPEWTDVSKALRRGKS